MKSHSEKFAKLKQFLRSKTAKICAIAFAVVGIGAVSFGSVINAWGPVRSTYRWPHGATSITFNSMTGNPSWGDERAFTVVRDLGTNIKNLRSDAADGNGFKNEVKAQAGHYYMVKMFVHNNAQQQLNLVAKNTKVAADMVTAATDGEILIQGRISADNCGVSKSNSNGSACAFWDEASLTGTKGTYLKASYVNGSARYYNETNKNRKEGFKLSNSIVDADDGIGAEGALIGYKSMDGNLPGCTQYAGFATFIVKVEKDVKPNFTIEKKVRIKGSGEGKDSWKDSVTAQPGQKVEYKITYKNTSDKVQTEPIIADLLPTGVKYTAGSSELVTTKYQDGTKLNDDWKVVNYPLWNIDVDKQGFAAQATADVYINATLPDESELYCGKNTLKNYAIGYVKGTGSVLDNADVSITRDCVPCEYDKYLPADDPKCQPPKEVCEYDDNLAADDPKCVKPANTGFTVPPTAKFGVAILALALAAVVITRYHFAKKRSNKSEK